MLIGRGPVYHTELKASQSVNPDIPDGKYHAHCGCTVEPVYGDWKPTMREERWIDQYFSAAEKFPKGEKTWQNILPVMRDSGDFRDSPSRTVPWPEKQGETIEPSDRQPHLGRGRP